MTVFFVFISLGLPGFAGDNKKKNIVIETLVKALPLQIRLFTLLFVRLL